MTETMNLIRILGFNKDFIVILFNIEHSNINIKKKKKKKDISPLMIAKKAK